METQNLKQIRNLKSKFSMKLRMIAILMLSVQVLFGQGYMSLGGAQLIVNPQVDKSQRTLSSVANLSEARVWSKLGGVVFGDTAIASPSLSINSMSLMCDVLTSKSFVVINQQKYEIDLPIWQLQPIVKFANDSMTSVITLYGDSICPVRIHEAFLDNLMGLRLLQTDLMLAGNYLNPEDSWDIPKNDRGESILADSEKSLYKNKQRNKIHILLNEISKVENNNFNTYIFTDYQEPFVFDIQNGKFVINGFPYYKFAKRDTSQVDYEDFLDAFLEYQQDEKRQKEEYAKIFLQETYRLSKCAFSPTSFTELKITKIIQDNNLNIDSKGEQIREIIWDEKFDENVNGYIEQQKLFLENLNKLATEILLANRNYFKNNPDSDVEDILLIIGRYYKSENYLDNNTLVCFIKDLADYHSNSAAMKKLNDLVSKEYTEDKDVQVILYSRILYNTYVALKAHMVNGLTDTLKQKHELIYSTNPVVYDAAYNTAKWTSFFRYVKANYPKTWNTFVTNVQKLKYDAPIVQTPIKIIPPPRDE